MQTDFPLSKEAAFILEAKKYDAVQVFMVKAIDNNNQCVKYLSELIMKQQEALVDDKADIDEINKAMGEVKTRVQALETKRRRFLDRLSWPVKAAIGLVSFGTLSLLTALAEKAVSTLWVTKPF